MEIEAFTAITYTVNNGVALVKLNNPERRNAWSGIMSVEYRWALHHAHTDPDVRVVVLTGEGADFCVGADTRLLNNITKSGGDYKKTKRSLPPYPEGTPDEFKRNHAYPLTISTPIIAAINGACAGAGFLVPSYADIRFGAHNNKIKSSFSRLGLPAEYGLGWLLPRVMGIPNALQLMYNGDTISAEEALRLGWLQAVYEPDDLLPKTMEFAYTIARESSGQSLKFMKRQMFIDASTDFSSAYTRSVDDMNSALTHPDMKEGLRAIKQKRATNFLTNQDPKPELEGK